MRGSGFSLAVVFLALVLPGCSKVAYETSLPGGGTVYERRLDYYALGLVGEHDVYLDEICPRGVHGWYTEASLFGLLDLVTLGVYSPRRLVVECAGDGDE